MAEIILQPHQNPGFDRCTEIFGNWPGAIVCAPTGSGKTYLAGKLAINYGFSIMVVCEKSLVPVWESFCKEHGITLLLVVTYASLSSRSGSQPKHGLLTRSEKPLTFSPTKKFKSWLKVGIMVIFDECQNLKNVSAKTKAATAITQAIMAGGLSRFLLLSATPFDKPDHAINFLRVMGIISKDQLAHQDLQAGEYALDGAQEVLDVCNHLDEETTETVVDEYGSFNKNTTRKILFDLWTKVITPAFLAKMEEPATVFGGLEMKNGFFSLSRRNRAKYNKALEKLKNAAKNGISKNLGALTVALREMEESKAADMTRVAISTLEKDPNAKVILALNYINTMEEVVDVLSDYNPMLLYGATSTNDRDTIVQRFQRPDNKYRVIVMNVSVGGVGLSLHDTTGEHNRYMLISPSYSTIKAIQCSGRIHRDGKGWGYCWMFYVQDSGQTELNILTKLAEKSTVIKTMTGDNKNNPLPCDYESVWEEKDGSMRDIDIEEIVEVKKEDSSEELEEEEYSGDELEEEYSGELVEEYSGEELEYSGDELEEEEYSGELVEEYSGDELEE